ncbi:MAG TPA: Crp/Fnr family transcriptional regulator [Candidatus Elarobacter sp.]|jgi:CRP/FNR family transcriptional regulator|nr:Crp/Fnr family transcriptional regulator [Candidatus Elarobacter sp.]
MSGLETVIEHGAMRIERTPDDGANKVWYLERSRLFAGTNGAGVAGEAEGIFTMYELPRGARVFDLGDTTRVVYLVKRGTVRLARETPDGKDVTVALLGAGDLFGEETLFDGAPRTTVAVVVEDALLCSSRAEDLFGLLRRDPQIAVNVAKILSGRLGEANAAMEDLAYARVGDRIVHLYRKLAQEHGVPVAGGTRIELRLTHADVASAVGSTRETVSAEIAKLVDAGRLRQEGRAIVVPDEEPS